MLLLDMAKWPCQVKGKQDHLGANSGNWLASWPAESSTTFPIFPDLAGQNRGTRLRLLKTCMTDGKQARASQGIIADDDQQFE